MDGQFSGFDAGVFTYALTQYLWQKTANESLTTTFSNVNQNAKKIAWEQRGGLDKEPEIESNLKLNQNKLIYFSPVKTIPAEAVVTGVSGAPPNSNIELWLGGIEAQSLEGFNEKAILNIIDAKGDEFLNLTDSLINDLDRLTRGPSTGSTPLPSDVRGIDVTKVATMSIPFEVTKSV